MPDDNIIIHKFELVIKSIDIIIERSSAIKTPDDFMDSPFGVTQLDSIAMRLQFIGESIKSIDKYKPGLLNNYNNIKWNDIIKFRDFISHHYYLINPEVIFNISKDNLPVLKTTIEKIIKDLNK